MIKGIVLDIDGVIVGEKIGYNSPFPHPLVIKKLKELREKGIPIVLCTAKPHFSIMQIINDAGLNNLHITNGGGIIIDPIHQRVLRKHVIEKENAQKVISEFINNDVYVEFYTQEDYFIQKNQISLLTKTHTHILQREPVITNSLADESNFQEIVKIMPIAKNEKDKQRIVQLFRLFKDILTLSWGIHPIALPHIFGIVTAKGISKKQAVLEIALAENIKSEELLGIGDSTSDWQYIEECKYAGAVENGSEELKKLVLSKGTDFSYIGQSVDANGVLDILGHFL